MKDLNSINNINNLQDYESLKKVYDELQNQEVWLFLINNCVYNTEQF